MFKNWRQWVILGIAILSFAGFTYASTSFSISMGTDNFYASVGNYDYFPYSYSQSGYGYGTPRINFYDVMADYGTWVYVAPFGQVWRPYATQTWRPYVQGHWIYTSYGPTWVGYEPWAWAGYHYGNWIWTQRFGWVWIPGYDWHPGRVAWSHGYDAIGWMPAPPAGYDYSQGYLSYRGNYNQFSYNDQDFDYYGDNYGNGYNNDYYRNNNYGYNQDSYYYGGPYYDPRYRDLYYNPGYRSIVINLWVFIGTDHFGYNNYSDYYLDRDFTRNLFERRLVRISSRPLDRPVLERVVKQRIREVPVQVREIETDKKRVKMIVPEGEDKDIRENANRVVKDVIAPAFVKERKNFKGLQARNAQSVNKMFRQENKRPEIRTISGDDLVREVQQVEKTKEERRNRLVREKADSMIQIERQGKIHERKDRNRQSQGELENNNSRDKQGEVEKNNGRDNQFENRSYDKNEKRSQEERKQDRIRNSDQQQEDQFRSNKRQSDERSNQDVQQKEKNRDSQFENKKERSTKQDNNNRPSDQSDQEKRRYEEQQKPDHGRNQQQDQNENRRLDKQEKEQAPRDQQFEKRDDHKRSDAEVKEGNQKDSDRSSDKNKKDESGKKNKKKDSKEKKHPQDEENNSDNNRE